MPQPVVLPTDKESLNATLDELMKDDAPVEGEKDDDKIELEINEANKPKKDEKPSKEDDKEEDDDKKDKETTDEDEEEEPLKLDDEEDEVEIIVPVKRQEILKAFPELFKKFPYVERALYREQQFTEYFPTPKAAKEAVEKVEFLGTIEKELFDGTTAGLLGAVKNQDPEAFKSLVDNVIVDIAKVDKDAANHLFGNIIKHTIVGMVQKARSSGSEELESAAQNLYKFYFGDSDWTPPVNLGDGKKKDNSVEEERAAFHKERFESAFQDLDKRVNNVLRSTIDTAIDPKNMMTDYVKSKAIEDTINDLHDALNGDKRFKSILDSLWAEAGKVNYNSDSQMKIRKAYLSRAKSELIALIRKNRDKALKGLGKPSKNSESRKAKEDNDDEEYKGSRQPEKPSAAPKKRMSTFDFLNQD